MRVTVDVVLNVGRVEDGEKGRPMCAFLQAQTLLLINNQLYHEIEVYNNMLANICPIYFGSTKLGWGDKGGNILYSDDPNSDRGGKG